MWPFQGESRQPTSFSMILVTGGTGNVGGELVRALAAAGEEPRALVRENAAAGLPAGVEAVPGDLNRPETVLAALTGARGLFLLPGYCRVCLPKRIESASSIAVLLIRGRGGRRHEQCRLPLHDRIRGRGTGSAFRGRFCGRAGHVERAPRLAAAAAGRRRSACAVRRRSDRRHRPVGHLGGGDRGPYRSDPQGGRCTA